MHLLACSKKISIEYLWKPSRTLLLREENHALVVEGNILRRSQVYQLLKKWLLMQSKNYFLPLVKQQAAMTGLGYKNVRCKNQKTRWGSCSEHGNINLNIQLLFLPEYLVKHVILHELCHTKFLNHSRDFWKLVSTVAPSYKEHEHELKKGRSYIPKWLTRL